MKKFKFIFIFIFLSGMLLTVFQYIPILEEEAQNHSTELAKKNGEDDSAGDDNVESDVDEAINAGFNFNFTLFASSSLLNPIKKEEYNSFFQKINIPPPKA